MGAKPKKQKKKLEIKINLQQGIQDFFSLPALIDSGAEGCFIDEQIVQQQGLLTRNLKKTIPVFNVNGTPNVKG